MSQTYDPPAHSTRRKRLCCTLLAVPVVWAAAILAIMRPDAIEAREEVPFEIKWMFYDESDLGALVLRGANAEMGRLPGRMKEPDWDEPKDIAARLDHPPPGYEERYYLEYPTATLPIFRLGYLLDSDPVQLPPAIADAHHYGIAHFIPRNDAERAIWSRLRTATRVHIVLMAAALIGLMLVLAWGYEPGGVPPPVWLAVLPGAVFFALNRFDVLPALMTALAFAALGRGRPAWSGAWLAAGVLLKVYPVLLVPVILRYLGPARGGRWLVGFAAVIAAGVAISWAALGWESTIAPIQVQFSRTLPKVSWTFYGKVLPEELAHSKWGRLGILAAAIAGAVATRPKDLASVLRRCGVVLAVFVILSVFWSPQWILWFLPILVPLAAGRRWILWTTAALDLANYFNFPILFWILWNRLIIEVTEPLGGMMIYIRAVLWFGLAAGLVWEEWRCRREASRPTE